MRADQHERYGRSSGALVESFRRLLAFLVHECTVPANAFVVTIVDTSIHRNDLACAWADALQDRRQWWLWCTTVRSRVDATLQTDWRQTRLQAAEHLCIAKKRCRCHCGDTWTTAPSLQPSVGPL